MVPSIIQKKISKILRKIQLITQFSGSGSSSNGSGTTTTDGEISDFDDFFKDEDEEKGEGESITEAVNDKKEEVEEITVGASSMLLSNTEEPSKYSVSPSSVAVFFMELIGTVMGLFYGAVAQIGNGQNSKS